MGKARVHKGKTFHLVSKFFAHGENWSRSANFELSANSAKPSLWISDMQ